jgi:hypothetical protein
MKLTIQRLKKLIREELENTNEAIKNPPLEHPQAYVDVDFRGNFEYVLFSGMTDQKTGKFRLTNLSDEDGRTLANMIGKGMTIGDVPGLAEKLSRFVTNVSATEIAKAKVV